MLKEQNANPFKLHSLTLRLCLVFLVMISSALVSAEEQNNPESPNPSQASSPNQPLPNKKRDSLMIEVLREAAKKYQQELKTAILKEAAKMALEHFGKKKAAEMLSQAFAAYNFYESAKQYDQADSDLDKFNAGFNLAADGLALVNPAAGAKLKLVAIGYQLSAALVLKDYNLAYLRIIDETLAIYTETAELTQRMIKSEKTWLDSQLAMLKVTTYTNALIAERFKQECLSGAQNLDAALECQKIIAASIYFSELQIDTLSAILNASLTYLDLDKLMTAADPNWNRSSIEQTLRDNENSLKKQKKVFEQSKIAFAQYIDDVVIKSLVDSPELAHQRKKIFCEKELNRAALDTIKQNRTNSKKEFEFEEDKVYAKRETAAVVNSLVQVRENFCREIDDSELSTSTKMMLKLANKGAEN